MTQTPPTTTDPSATDLAATDLAATDPAGTRPSRRVLVARFVRHYVEMVVAMFAGMVVLGALLRPGLGALGLAGPAEAHPYATSVEMALTMSAGMAFWMRYRRHHWRHVLDMTAAMVLPLAVLFPLAWAGLVAPASLSGLGHVLMFPLMLAVMLRHPGAYTGPVDGRLRLRDRPRLRRALVALGVTAVSVAVPLGVGFAGLASRTAGAFEASGRAVPPAAWSAPLPVHDPSRPTAVVVVGPRGAVAGDTLGPFETLAASKAFNTYLVAPGRAPVPLAGGLDVVPQLSFADLAARLGGKAPDAVLVPAMPDAGEPSNVPVRDWVRDQHRAGALLVGVCAGARVVASAGLLEGHAATSHWYRLGGLERDYPGTDWRRGVRYVDDGDVVTTAGVLSGIDGALRVVERLGGTAGARSAADAVGWRTYSPGRPATIPDRSVGALGTVALLDAGFRSRPTIGVRLDDGVGELDLAAVFDTYAGQSFSATALTVAPGGGPVTSRHGLTFLPRSTPDDAVLDRTIVPGAGPTGFPYDAALADLARTADVPTARWTARTLEYDPADLALTGPGLSPALVARPVLLALGTAALLLGLIHALRRRTRPAAGMVPARSS